MTAHILFAFPLHFLISHADKTEWRMSWINYHGTVDYTYMLNTQMLFCGLAFIFLLTNFRRKASPILNVKNRP